MDPRGKKVEKFFKYKEARASYLALAIVAAVIGAFVVGAVVKAADVLTPPTALFPDQGSLPDIGGGGGGAGNLLDALKGGSIAKWADFKNDTVIGGRLGLGQVIFSGDTPQVKYPLDIQVDYVPTESLSATDKHDTAIIRLAGQNEDPANPNRPRMWTGLQLARMDRGNATTPFVEKWFVGMSDQNDHFIIRANNTDPNIVDIDPDKGAACIGGMFQEITGARTDGALGGYEEAHKKCSSGMHVCSTEEMLRSVQCSPGKVKAITSGASAWINSSPVTGAAVADCQGWNSNSPDVSGVFWSFDGKTGSSWAATCNSKKKVACCR